MKADEAMFVELSIDNLAKWCYENAVAHGFYDNPQEDGTRISLMHSELSEALEALRNGNPPDDKCPEHNGCLVELADTVIRIADFCARNNWSLGAAIVDKMCYNVKRPHMHGGKKF